MPTAPKNTYIICEASVPIAHVFNIFQHYRNRFPSKELIEFFNGAILAVTGNAVHQVHRPRAGFSRRADRHEHCLEQLLVRDS